ncbi:hypothetical protein KAU43_05065 [candidate division WOR-3 bacterium]|nr:hypothetical protein [candidate division WOR-3 bacterium]
MRKLRARRCPKCRKYPDSIHEIFEATITYDIGKHGLIDKESSLGFDQGLPCGVMAECSCGHRWKLNEIEQIDELEID